MHRREKLAWAAVLIGSALAVSVMFIFYRVMVGVWLPQILTQVETDSIYYLTNVHQVVRGHWMIGNPYLAEYWDAVYPGLLFPTWVTAIPGLLGAGINAVYVINALLYGILTGAFLYVICRRITDRTWLAAGLAVLGVASLSNLLTRPIVMQTVYPVFGFFMLALLGVVEKPHAAKRYVPLAVASALAFYVYPHLWMQNFTSVGLLCLWALWKKDAKMLRNLAMMIGGVIVVCIPQIMTTVALFTDPAVSAINKSVGLVDTHAVLPLTIMNIKYSILVALGLLALRMRRRFSTMETLLCLLTLPVIIAAVSNVVTGKLMDFHSHPWRLGLMVNIVTLAVLYRSFGERRARWDRIVIGFCLAAIVFTTVNRTFIRLNSYGYLLKPQEVVHDYAFQKDYARVFAFLKANGVRDRVILADEQLGSIIPLYTDNGVLFCTRAALHTVPADELLERFLAYFVNDVDAEFLKAHVSDYAGLTHKETITYKNAYPDPSLGGIIRAFGYGLIGKTLPGTWHEATLIDEIGGQPVLDAMLARHKEIRKNYEQYLRKYHVAYVIEDKKAPWNPLVPQHAKKVFTDDRFTVYAL